MLDIRLIREQPDTVRENIRRRNMTVELDALLAADQQALDLQKELERVRQRQNEIGKSMKGPMEAPARQALVEEGRALKETEAGLAAQLAQADARRDELLRGVPNLTHPQAPNGVDDTQNREVRRWGDIPQLDFAPKDHLELMESLDLIDFEGAARVTGQKFYYLKNEAVLLELALVTFACNLLREEGFVLHITPDLARQEILQGIGFNPRGDSAQIYNIENTDLSLVATAEITLGGLLAGSVLEAEQLPLLYAGVSHCFRTEAGSHGRESKGLYRVHQFTKVEMFAFCPPEQSEALHEKIVSIEEKIYQQLGIPYRVVDVCAGDLGAPAFRKYDLEAWMPGRGKWGEVTSASNCTDYQARRLDIRFKEPGKKGTRFAHMLNGTAIAVSRTLIALIENGQQADGSIRLPACLGLAPIRPK
ncbi:MAG: serine--tRNA ligase [Deltaproteobacteria bacterium]|nr:serine--tRNA ligase [Deltaproteobacteria bacterium]